ncbi:MAG: HAD-IIA family hydrolase [Candidatus Micrarchaeota archaeon]|nr:HAD-IIA family hydrolase [Candidatus Micrarchaeota archaeon]
MNIKNIIFDLDGVIYLGDKLIQGADCAIKKLEKNFNLFFLTNNATMSREQIQQKLNSLNIKAKKEQILSSAFAAATKAKNEGFRYAYVVGEDGLKKEVKEIGLLILSDEEILKGDFSEDSVLISGLDKNFNYFKLKLCLRFLQKANNWIACNLDPNYPVEDGLDPGAGAIAASIAFSLGYLKNQKIILRNPDVVVGKPSDFMLNLFLKKEERKNSLFVGDRLDVDVFFAKKHGLVSALVLSGVSKKEEIKKFFYKPDFVINSVAELPALFSQKSHL